jgi:hypothetical protein
MKRDVIPPLRNAKIAQPYTAAAHGVRITSDDVTGQVLAPEDGTIYVAANTNAGVTDRNGKVLFEGDGPAFVYLRGAETGYWHLLAGLSAVGITAGQMQVDPPEDDPVVYNVTLGPPKQVTRGAAIGSFVAGKAIFWQVTQAPVLPGHDGGYYVAAGEVDPVAWLRDLTSNKSDDADASGNRGDSAAGLVLLILVGLAFLRGRKD